MAHASQCTVPVRREVDKVVASLTAKAIGREAGKKQGMDKINGKMDCTAALFFNSYRKRTRLFFQTQGGYRRSKRA